jgi:monoamine oxidase
MCYLAYCQRSLPSLSPSCCRATPYALLQAVTPLASPFVLDQRTTLVEFRRQALCAPSGTSAVATPPVSAVSRITCRPPLSDEQTWHLRTPVRPHRVQQAPVAVHQ